MVHVENNAERHPSDRERARVVQKATGKLLR
jgi:hypothetical protein